MAAYALGKPGAWSDQPWEGDHVAKVGPGERGKIFAFLGANLTKTAHGGWFPLSIGILLFAVLSTWRRGTRELQDSRIAAEGSLRSFVDELHAADPQPPRTPGTAVYLNARRETTPLALRASFEHAHALHESIVIISIETTRTSFIEPSARTLGTRNSEIPRVPAGASGVRARTKWTILSAMSWSPNEM